MLVSVIWIVLLIAVLSAAFALTTRLNVKTTANLAHHAQGQMMSDGLVYWLALEAAAEPPSAPGSGKVHNGSVQSCLLAGQYRVQYAVQDVTGLIDLNASSPRLLQRFFQALTNDEARARALSDGVLDFRDVDDQARTNGAESDEYASAGRTYTPKNAPFQAVEELDQVLGVDEDLFHAARRFVTIHSRRDGISGRQAPADLLELLKVSEGAGAGSGVISSTQAPGGRLAIDVAVQLAGQAGWATRRAVIAVLRRPNQPFAFLEWGGAVVTQPAAASDTDQDCPPSWGGLVNR